MNERILTPVQNAILNLVADTDYDPAIAESVKNETYADIMVDYRKYNDIFKPMTIKERALWYEKAWKDAAQKSLFWAKRLSYKQAERYPKWRKNMEFWDNQAKLYREECSKLRRIINNTEVYNG